MDNTPDWSDIIDGAITNRLRYVFTSQPGKILNYDPATRTALVQALVPHPDIDELGNNVSKPIPPIPSCPVIMAGGGGFEASFPVRAGDICLIIHCSVPTSEWKTGNGETVDVSDTTLHHVSSACALVGLGAFQGKRITDTDGVVIGGVESSDQRVKITQSEVLLGAGSAEPVATKTDLDHIKDCLIDPSVVAAIAGASVSGGGPYTTAVNAYFALHALTGSSVVKAVR